MSSQHTLTQLKIQQAKINAKIKRIEARLKKAEQKKEIRRQALVGAYVLKKAKTDQALDALLREIIPTLKTKRDRALFGLDLDKEAPTLSAAQETYTD